ncbi:MAG TPA: AraC family transcriptional regulator [Myxococcota bacterium]|jgi:AraC family transcriptional regulator
MANYRARIERAIRFIRERPSEPLRLRDVARAAALSEFHFHRVFSAVMGESVGHFITRTRLERAAFRLAYEPAASITEVALESGYSSVSNFSKAFSARFGRAPSRVRKPAALPAEVGKLVGGAGGLDPVKLYALPREASAAERERRYRALAGRVRFVRTPALLLACLASADGYEVAAIEAAWAELIERCAQLGIATADSVDAYGLSFDSPQLTRPELCRYHACVVCPDDAALSPPLFRGEIPAGRYAVFPYAGAASEVERTYRAIYSLWLPRSSLRPDEFVLINHYVTGGPVRGQIEMEIWIKVRAR